MARASIPTLLPIDSYAKIMGISPWEFNQISGGLPTATRGSCQSVWFQWQWQKDFVSREEIAQAISEAESAIAHQLGYWPAPAFVVDEHVSINRGAPMLPSVMGANAWGWWKNIPLRWSHWQAGGVFNRTIIQAAATVTLSDTDSDGVNDLFTITQAVTTTDPNEIAIYFQLTDRVGETSIGEQWRIRPIKVSISGGTATITGHPSQLVLPSKTEAVTAAELNISDPIFASEVDVYRVFTDTQHDSSYPYQGVALWDVPCNDGGDCGTTILPLCQAEARNDRVYANYGDPATWPYGWQPDRLQVNYLAGYPLMANGQMDSELARCVAYLATALLPSEKCGCERSNRILHYWRSKPNEGDAGRQFTPKEIDENPWNERQGALWAWKRVKEWRDYEPVRV